MPMVMMRVRVVLVGVSDRFVMMPVAVCGSCRDRPIVLVPMMKIMFVLMLVIHCFVAMHVGVMLGEM